MHVEVESSKALKALKSLSKHFGTTQSTLPGGQKMRFFSEFSRICTTTNQNKIKEMRKIQGIFLDTIEKVFSDDIHLLKNNTLSRICTPIKNPWSLHFER